MCPSGPSKIRPVLTYRKFRPEKEGKSLRSLNFRESLIFIPKL